MENSLLNTILVAILTFVILISASVICKQIENHCPQCGQHVPYKDFIDAAHCEVLRGD